jgi:DNA-binding response OmpR family regulator
VSATLLIIDDDQAMRAALRDNLEADGYRVLTASTYREGWDTALAKRPDLILLDVMLPDGDGMLLCRALRDVGLRTPIIMLTARAEERDRVLGLDLGTDDYVVKPFSLRELLARIRAHLRRGRSAAAAEIAIGAARLNLRSEQLQRDGQILEMSSKEFELLRYLVAHRGDVLSREVLLRDVWGHRAEIETRTVDNFIVRLRKKLEPDPAQPRYLLTVHGSGYKLVDQ